jgi:GH25 family lysozyme M1 (1,4-beta-N-acetylmuramidase)/LysM repeat protein
MALTGIDISGWQAGVDLSTVPADFVLIKATGGNGFVSPACDAQYQAARAAGKLVGVYHFAHEAGYQSDAVTEANFFVANIKGYLTGDTLLVLDFEGDNSRDVAWAKTFLDTVHALTGVKPVIYLNTAELAESDWSPVYGADYGLWVAQYAVVSPTEGYLDYAGNPATSDAPPAVNWGGNSPLMWQFADNARLPGWAGGLDADVLYGDADTWHAYCRPDGAPAAAPAPITPAPAPAPAPAQPAAAGQATVEANDTLSGIAAQVGVSLGDLEAVNPGINYDVIQPGQVINLPAGANLAALHGAPAPAAPAAPVNQCVVELGDSLSSIAEQFGTTVDHLCEVNGIENPNLIFPGQVLNF